MPKPVTWPPASPGERPLPEPVRASCQKLLAQDNLPG